MENTTRISAIHQLDRQHGLTGNQRILVATAAIGCMLEFWEQYLIAFVLAFVIRPWDCLLYTSPSPRD